MTTVSLLVLIAGALQCSGPFDCNSHLDSTFGIAIWLAIMLYMFKALGTICDDYFVPAIDAIVERLGMSPDVAGATLLAAGSSAPELATSLIATFLIVGEGGVGTIIGSAVFNILVIVGLTGWIACKDRPLKIWWYPLLRDSTFYTASICELLLFVRDNRVEWWESGLMVATYGLYCAYMRINPMVVERLGLQTPAPAVGAKGNKREPAAEGDAREDGDEVGSSVPTTASWDTPQTSEGDDVEVEAGQSSQQPAGDTEQPVAQKSRSWRCLLWDPLSVALEHTLPSPEKHYWSLFGLSVVLIAVASYLMVDATERIGQILTIDEMAMGLVFLAAGTSIPDALGSIAVAKQGEGDMAVANALGSNVFDILMGLGLPWLLYAIIFGEPLTFQATMYDMFQHEVLLLVVVLFIFVGCLAANKWQLTRTVGVALLLFYAVYVVYAIVFRPCALQAFDLPTKTACVLE